MMTVAVTGGKGGTGKSTVAVNLAVALASTGYRVVLADLDVEGCVDHLLLKVGLKVVKPIKVPIPFIDYGKCVACGACTSVCDTGALISVKGGKPFLIPRLCSGCEACFHACRFNAIRKGWRVIGEVSAGKARFGDITLTLVSGRLREGEEHVAPAVIAAREEAITSASEEDADFLVIDTAAGTGIAVSQALSTADLVLAVTEPTPLGAHDLDAILELTSKLGVRTWVVVNKHGLAPENIVAGVVSRYGVPVVARIPYSDEVVHAYVSGEPLVLREGSVAGQELRALASAVASLASVRGA